MASPSMSLGINVKGIEGLSKRFDKVYRWATVEVQNLTFEQADKGAEYAASIAPYQSGELVRAIKPMAGPKSNSARIVSGMPKNQKNMKGLPRSKPVPYQLFIALGKYGYRGNNPGRTTGQHQYMAITADWLRKEYPEVVARSLAKTLQK